MRVYTDSTFERHVNRSSGVEVPERLPAALAGVAAAGSANLPVERCPCKPAPEKALRAVHDPSYLDLLARLSADGGVLDPDTALGPGSWESTLLASGAAALAADSALSGEAAFAVARPPGHHSGRDYAMGFCLTNHAAVAAAHARSVGVEKVAILDWDVHHGNGTQDIFYKDDGVLYLSVHRGGLFYPGTGETNEVGEGRGKGFTVNVPLPAGSGEDAYVAAFEDVFFPILREFRPELIVVSSGYDAHAADPLGGMRLKSASYERFAASLTVLSREVGAAPPALVLEGGYDLRALEECVAATIKGVEEGEPPAREHSPVGPVEAAREALAAYWESLR